ncbi:MAG: hypothetical protein H6822_14755 [Planctomycetaceae bacterium]|nr:hypothetical protein [Planctomycetales bacterium]MCB9923440.1 hypothetical protein [Planctomycetaceae bacterium]
MFHCLLPLLILSADISLPTASPLTQAEEVRNWDFEAGDDKNYDRWPDDWTRRRGKGYPLYLTVEVAEDPRPRQSLSRTSAAGHHALRMQLDGGAAVVYSPLVEISPLFSYVLNGYLKTEGLTHDVAYASVMLYDQDRKLLETHESPRHTQAQSWTGFQIGPLTPTSDEVRWAVVALHLTPTEKADLTGSAMFDDLVFAKLPRVSVETRSRNNIFTHPSDVEITCQVSGISHPNPRAKFELLDIHGNLVASHESAMTPDRANAALSRVFAGSATWHPVNLGYGFYRVLVSMSDHTSEPISANIAVLQRLPKSKQGEFGWSLPHGDDPVSLKDLVSLLEDVGIHWVKFPVWYGDDDNGRADALAWFAERMSARKISLVGMLDQPPKEVRELFGQHNSVPVASVFVEPEVWHPAVDPVMTRLSLKVQWWQLGGDRDTSFVNFPNLEETVGTIRKDFNRFGQQINLGIPWRSIDETPVARQPPWSFLSYVAKPALTPDEMKLYMSAEPPTTAKRWLIMEPLAKSEYSLETRARDIVSRMLTAKIEKADGVFIPDPFDSEHGLMTPDGSPDKMLLPWRTTAMMLAGATYVGSIEMPNGSSNQIFARGDQAVMVVWNEQPVDEIIYLGENVHQYDVWGRRFPPRIVREDGFARHEIKVTRLPTFITGVDPHIARWRMDFQFDESRIASVFGREQSLSYSFRNSFDQGVGGSVTLHIPELWEASQHTANFKLSANERHQRGFQVTLQPSVSSGDQRIRVDFQFNASRDYKFSIYRTLTVGLGDISVELSSRLDENGNLIIEQQLTNTTDEFVSFNCNLVTTKRRRERQQIFNRGRGTTTVMFVFPNGAELLGETMWLRVEEIDGPRILNHQIIARE